ncbi:MAG: PspC domain-containing protein [Treponema sp.]|jgi:phage shock protein PspC (stress-responsive transcriptional regulator)|nr:PspC domain-containing protein [Treponema sp.]
MAKPFHKSSQRKLCGVCGGIAEYFDLDPTLVRALWIVLIIFGGTGILLYIVLAILMPD